MCTRHSSGRARPPERALYRRPRWGQQARTRWRHAAAAPTKAPPRPQPTAPSGCASAGAVRARGICWVHLFMVKCRPATTLQATASGATCRRPTAHRQRQLPRLVLQFCLHTKNCWRAGSWFSTLQWWSGTQHATRQAGCAGGGSGCAARVACGPHGRTDRPASEAGRQASTATSGYRHLIPAEFGWRADGGRTDPEALLVRCGMNQWLAGKRPRGTTTWPPPPPPPLPPSVAQRESCRCPCLLGWRPTRAEVQQHVSCYTSLACLLNLQCTKADEPHAGTLACPIPPWHDWKMLLPTNAVSFQARARKQQPTGPLY